MNLSIEEHELRARRIPLPGTYNVRDLGGYQARSGRTRPGMLLRGDSLHRLDADGLKILGGMGIRTVIDLRDDDERALYPSSPLGEGVRVVPMSLASNRVAAGGGFGSGWTLADAYISSLRDRGVQLAGVIRELCIPGTLPALVHCMAGKDRTGIVIALVLSALGVPDEIVLADFAASSLFLGEAYRLEATARTLARGVDEDLVARILDNDPEHLRAALADIRDRYGDIAAYLREHGVTAGELDSLDEAFIEPAERAVW